MNLVQSPQFWTLDCVQSLLVFIHVWTSNRTCTVYASRANLKISSTCWQKHGHGHTRGPLALILYHFKIMAWLIAFHQHLCHLLFFESGIWDPSWCFDIPKTFFTPNIFSHPSGCHGKANPKNLDFQRLPIRIHLQWPNTEVPAENLLALFFSRQRPRRLPGSYMTCQIARTFTIYSWICEEPMHMEIAELNTQFFSNIFAFCLRDPPKIGSLMTPALKEKMRTRPFVDSHR